MIAILSLIVITALVITIYYDYRYREHWTGYKFGYSLPGLDRKIFLTFDDGPSGFAKASQEKNGFPLITDPAIREIIIKEIPDYDFKKSATENILILLEKYQVKGIFFLTGRSIEEYPEAKKIIQRMIKEGHSIGNHSFSHNHSRKIPLADVLEDFAHNHDLITSLSGQDINLFRPPYGAWESEFTQKFLSHPKLENYTFPIFWTTSFKDWSLQTIEELNSLDEHLIEFENSLKDKHGKIILFHDPYISSTLLAAKLLRKFKGSEYFFGEPADLVAAVYKETNLYKKAPFIYYMKILKDRLLTRFNLHRKTPGNCELEQ